MPLKFNFSVSFITLNEMYEPMNCEMFRSTQMKFCIWILIGQSWKSSCFPQFYNHVCVCACICVCAMPCVFKCSIIYCNLLLWICFSVCMNTVTLWIGKSTTRAGCARNYALSFTTILAAQRNNDQYLQTSGTRSRLSVCKSSFPETWT